MDVERYTELRATGDERGIQRWVAIDSLTRERVSLWTTSVADTNADAVRELRAEAARLRQRGVDARVFEDLRRGLVGLAFGGPIGASPTRPQTRAGATEVGAAPAAPARAVGARTTPRRVRVVPLVAFGVVLAGVSTVVTWWAIRPRDTTGREDATTEREDATTDALESGRAPARTARPTATWRTSPAGEPTADGTPTREAVRPPVVGETASPDVNDRGCGADVAISTGCVDRNPVRETDARGCTTCPPPTSSSQVVGGDDATRRAMEKEFDACDARRTSAATGSARCAAFDVAEAYCGARGGRVPTEAEWREGAAAGMSTEPDLYEWTRDVVRERMNWTRGPRGRSQADRHVRSPTLGFRCVR